MGALRDGLILVISSPPSPFPTPVSRLPTFLFWCHLSLSGVSDKEKFQHFHGVLILCVLASSQLLNNVLYHSLVAGLIARQTCHATNPAQDTHQPARWQPAPAPQPWGPQRPCVRKTTGISQSKQTLAFLRCALATCRSQLGCGWGSRRDLRRQIWVKNLVTAPARGRAFWYVSHTPHHCNLTKNCVFCTFYILQLWISEQIPL